MSAPKEDELWPRASAWLRSAEPGRNFDLGLMGIPAHLTSISATDAHTTPAAIRAALQRYSTYNWTTETDVATLSFADFGDVSEPDSEAGEARTSQLAAEASAHSGLAIGLGGDNSVTFAMARGVFGSNIETAGLITLDAHHDLRDGISNGSPVRRLIEAGLPGASADVRGDDGVHFEATVVAEAFRGKLPLARHRMVYATLGDLMGGAIHALQLRTQTPDEAGA